MLQGFFTPGEPDTTGDYEDRVRKRRLAEAMMAQGMDYSPVKSWTQGAARIAQALVGGYASSKYDREQKAADAPGRAILEAEIQRRMGDSPSPAMPSATVPSGASAPRAAAFSGSQDEFVASMMPHALKVSQETGLDPRLVIAQSALETGWGKSAPGNNFFGIKSHGRAGGNTMPTTEVVNGQPVRMNDSFRAYADMGESAGDYVAFLRANPRYRDVLGAQGLDAQIEAMARSGYATDPNYGAKLRQIAAGLQAPDGMPMAPVPSDAPPMAYAPGQQAIAGAMPQNPPMPPPRPGAALVGAVGGQQPQPVTSPPIPQPDGSQRLLAAALSSSSSPQLRAQLMQLYQMTQREQPKWEKLNDGTLYNPRNAETRTVGDGYRALIDPAERARYGIKPDDQNPYYVDPAGKPSALGRPSTNVTVNNENRTETAADTEAAKALVRRNVAAMDAADKAQAAMADINTMREISRRVGSVGSTADLKAAIGPYAEAVGVNLDGLSDIQAFEAVIQRMAPQMRAEGSGSTSDIEFKGMLASLPRLRFNPQAREMILDTLEANARYNIMRGDIALKVLTKEIKREDGEKQMRALGDPMQAFREFRKANPSLFTGPPPKDAPPDPDAARRERALEILRQRGRT
jgi:flagellum-specific peptidoglycan hydrolase FlgJ